MKAMRILENLTNIHESYIEEAAPGTAPRGYSRKRIVLIALAAAIALLLVSCGVVSVIYGNSIQGWFQFYWHRITGEEIAGEQTAIIDHLSQEIGVSATDGDVTVTVDSATVSEDVFFLLLQVEGHPFSSRNTYDFDRINLEISPDPIAASGGMGSYGIKYLGIGGDGAALFLLDHQCSLHSGFEADTESYAVSLTLTDLTTRRSSRTRTVEKGEWSLTFPLDRSQLPESVSLPDTVVPGIDLRTGETIELLLTDIVLTNTGIRFQHLSENGNIDILSDIHWISPLLTNGNRIEDGSGSGVPIAGTDLLSYSWHWPIPLNIEDIVSVRIGETDVPVP